MVYRVQQLRVSPNVVELTLEKDGETFVKSVVVGDGRFRSTIPPVEAHYAGAEFRATVYLDAYAAHVVLDVNTGDTRLETPAQPLTPSSTKTAVSALYEWCAREKVAPPTFDVRKFGPDHCPRIVVTATVVLPSGSDRRATAEAGTVKHAKQDAALELLKLLQ